MPTASSLPIDGYRGEAVPNEFLRQEDDADHLAILLPGLGYTCDMPLFYYAELLLLDRGADVLRVEYAYRRRHDFLDLPPAKQRRWLLADATAAYRAGLGQRPYRDLTIVAKSLGTLALGQLLATEPRLPGETRAVWLTPLFRDERLRHQMLRFDGRTLLAISTADPDHDPTVLGELRRTTGAETVVVDRADHSLDVPGDAVASIRTVERVVGALRDFLACEST